MRRPGHLTQKSNSDRTMPKRANIEIFNDPQRIATLSTIDAEGHPNAAVFDSLRMLDDQTVIMACGANRTLANLRKNPKAVCLFTIPGDNPLLYQGGRLYLTVDSIEETGETLKQLREGVRKAAGEMAANSIRAAVTFRVTGFRPLIDRLA